LTIKLSAGISDSGFPVEARKLDAALVQEAVTEAGTRPRLAWMADQLDVSEEFLLPHAAKYFGARALSMGALRKFEPDFNLASFADCQRRGCIVGRMRGEPRLLVVVSGRTHESG